jgi:hypothetical protein
MQYTREDLKEILSDSKFEMKEVSGTRLSEDNPKNIPADILFSVKHAHTPESLSIRMSLTLDSQVATLTVVGNCTLELEEGWEIRWQDFDAFVAHDCMPTMYPPLRQSLSLLNYQLGLPHLLLPPQLSERQRGELSKTAEDMGIVRYEADKAHSSDAPETQE